VGGTTISAASQISSGTYLGFRSGRCHVAMSAMRKPFSLSMPVRVIDQFHGARNQARGRKTPRRATVRRGKVCSSIVETLGRTLCWMIARKGSTDFCNLRLATGDLCIGVFSRLGIDKISNKVA